MSLIVDTHAHFALRRNKSAEEESSRKSYQAKRMLDDLNKLKFTVGGKKAVVDEENLLEDYIKVMELNGISCAWIHQLSFRDILGYDVLSNEDISEAVKKYPDKLRGFASVDPRKGREAVKELAYAIEDLGLHGFKLNPNDYGGFYVNDKKLYPLYEKCCEYKIPVSIHTGITPGSVFRMRHNYPLLLDDVAVDFPDLTIIVEHMGFPWNDLCYNMVGRHENMYITVTAVANILVHTRPNIFLLELAKMLSQLGSEKILWGSDWTVTSNIGEVLDFFKNISLPAPIRFMAGIEEIKKSDIENILGLNALRILR